MQGQLETCDLEECDFLQVKLLEYTGHETEIKDTYQADMLKENDIIQEGLTAQGLPKGLVLSFKKIITLIKNRQIGIALNIGDNSGVLLDLEAVEWLW